ncbi:MAG: FAD-dependent oxidoreductase [Candidatus Bathyarchaeia archaeon]
MLRYGIPNYRLPKNCLDEDIQAILSLKNIEVKCKLTVGVDISLEDIYNRYDAVYIAIGAQAGKKLDLAGVESANVFSAVDILREVGRGNQPDFTGKKVVVIGGGNVAMDAARAAIRCKAKDVSIVYRRRKEDMPALSSEIEGAIAEGVELLTLQAPCRIEADEKGNCTALWTKPQMIGMYHNGRPSPVDAGEELVRIPCDVILFAIGEDVVSKPFEDFGLKTNGKCFDTTETCAVKGKKGVFAGGDCVTGPATVIAAIAAGYTAAHSIDKYLGYNHRLTSDVLIPIAKVTNRVPMGRLSIREREARMRKNDFEPVEKSISYEEAMQEASRCLRCDCFGYGTLAKEKIV